MQGGRPRPAVIRRGSGPSNSPLPAVNRRSLPNLKSDIRRFTPFGPSFLRRRGGVACGTRAAASDGGPRLARLTRAAADDLGRGFSPLRVTAAILRNSGRGVPVDGELLAVIRDSKLDSVKRPWRCRTACRRWVRTKSEPHSFQARAESG